MRHNKEKKQLIVVCLFERLFFFLRNYRISTECTSYCCYTRLCVATDVSQLPHTVEDRAFSCLVGRIPIDVVRNTARVSTIVCWSGKRHTQLRIKNAITFKCLMKYFCNLKSVTHQVFVSILRIKEAVFCYPIRWALTDSTFETTTGLSFKLMNLFEFLLVEQLSAT